MQLLISPASSLQPGQPQVTVVQRTDSQPGSSSASVSQSKAQKGAEEQGSSHDNDDAGSTVVMCDQTANDSASNISTTSDEYYECNESEPSEQRPNGVTTGSGRDGQGHRHGDGVNMMARFSQSMLDLRPHSQSEESTVLSNQIQQSSSKTRLPQHRHIGQLFQSSRSPGRDSRLRGGAKVVIAKPGSFHRPPRAAGPVIGGHRYWHGQLLQPDRMKLPPETRGSRSPRRHSPDSRRSGLSSGHASPGRSANASAPQGWSFSKLTNLKYLRGRDHGGALLKKTSLGNKDAS